LAAVGGPIEAAAVSAGLVAFDDEGHQELTLDQSYSQEDPTMVTDSDVPF
jgi:hypothetical protein